METINYQLAQRSIRILNPTYQTIHWYLRRFKKNICENCSKKGLTHLAKKHDKEHERNIDNYRELCVKCHIAYDRTEDKERTSLLNLSKTYSHQNRVMNKDCLYCGKSFLPAKKHTKFCSNKCSANGTPREIRPKDVKTGKWLRLNTKSDNSPKTEGL